MSEEAFKQFLKPYIRDGIPFLAYWHPNGMGLIRLDEVMVPVISPVKQSSLRKPAVIKMKPKQLSDRGRKTWEKNMAKLREQTWGRVITVEFDGKDLKTEGGFEL